ncbi:MAG: glycogen synthase, partial [bacterium]|nr:glycogen synthase [bacterium]
MTASLFTIHNLAYQGIFPDTQYEVTNLSGKLFTYDGLEFWDKFSLLKSGLAFSDIITTVSDTYASEIQTKRLGAGMDDLLRHRSSDLHGVLNGVDYDVWNPETDKLIEANYTARDLSGKLKCKKALLKEFGLSTGDDKPLIGIVSRLVDQKGFDIVKKAARSIIEMGFSMVLIGTGDKRYEEFFKRLSEKNPTSVG